MRNREEKGVVQSSGEMGNEKRVGPLSSLVKPKTKEGQPFSGGTCADCEIYFGIGVFGSGRRSGRETSVPGTKVRR